MAVRLRRLALKTLLIPFRYSDFVLNSGPLSSSSQGSHRPLSLANMVAQDPQKTSVVQNPPRKRGRDRRRGQGNNSNGKGKPPSGQATESGKPGIWLALTLVNIGLLVFLFPDLLNNQTIESVIKLAVIIAAASAFKAAWERFRKFLNSSPKQWWFKVVMVIAFCVLVFLNVTTRLALIPLYPVIAEGATVKVGGIAERDPGGKVTVSLGSHPVEIATLAGKYRPKNYELGRKDVFLAIFSKYTENWGPFYGVDLKTKVPNIQVEISKTDGPFDSQFLQDPQRTELFPRTKFELKPGTNNVFVWQATQSPVGTADVVYLPAGSYTFTPNWEGCRDKAKSINLTKVVVEGYLVDFRPLCSPH